MHSKFIQKSPSLLVILNDVINCKLVLVMKSKYAYIIKSGKIVYSSLALLFFVSKIHLSCRKQ